MITDSPEIISQSPAVASNDEPVIEITELKKSFGDQEVLKNISLKLMNGENLVVLGKSGSGKSVLIKCIVGLLTGDGGTITVFDKEQWGNIINYYSDGHVSILSLLTHQNLRDILQTILFQYYL